jgi:hypothetical protein
LLGAIQIRPITDTFTESRKPLPNRLRVGLWPPTHYRFGDLAPHQKRLIGRFVVGFIDIEIRFRFSQKIV